MKNTNFKGQVAGKFLTFKEWLGEEKINEVLDIYYIDKCRKQLLNLYEQYLCSYGEKFRPELSPLLIMADEYCNFNMTLSSHKQRVLERLEEISKIQRPALVYWGKPLINFL